MSHPQRHPAIVLLEHRRAQAALRTFGHAQTGPEQGPHNERIPGSALDHRESNDDHDESELPSAVMCRQPSTRSG